MSNPHNPQLPAQPPVGFPDDHHYPSHLKKEVAGHLLTVRRNLQELITIAEQMRAMNEHNKKYPHLPDTMATYTSFLQALEHNAVKLSSLMQQLPASFKNQVVLPFDVNGVHHGGQGVQPDWLLTCAEPRLRHERAEMVNAGRVELLQALAKRDEANAASSVGMMGRPAAKRRLGLSAALGSISAPGSSLGEGGGGQAVPERSDQELLERMQARITFHDRIVNATETYIRDSFVAKEHKLFRPYVDGQRDDFDDVEVGVTTAAQSTFARPSRPARSMHVAPPMDSANLGSGGNGVEKMDAGRMTKLSGIVESMVRR
ncbi:hypothetical protein BCR44DRAFT_1432158 [Catenaria anguillulae PL171]|uniref:Uncharacterized protein n=1 Tax=Catenaria anguillulae PL171 TaxID=765915 RepID=A0A1Y2HRZ6_9FUNG|nr:hypothetical protein BCR44DRAFT_1432158 [Catenaria anguillulae PL171]